MNPWWMDSGILSLSPNSSDDSRSISYVQSKQIYVISVSLSHAKPTINLTRPLQSDDDRVNPNEFFGKCELLCERSVPACVGGRYTAQLPFVKCMALVPGGDFGYGTRAQLSLT